MKTLTKLYETDAKVPVKNSKEELIQWYTQRLEKVKDAWGSHGDRGADYIKVAEDDLKAVKKGRNW